jgi:hypothetical protein
MLARISLVFVEAFNGRPLEPAMVERSPIFAAKSDCDQIGFTEDDLAFDLSGKRCCKYDERSGNLCDLNNERVIGHISLEGKFVGLSWMTDVLFPKSAGNTDPEFLGVCGTRMVPAPA